MTNERRNLIETTQILIARHFARLFSRSFHSFHFALTAGETPALPAMRSESCWTMRANEERIANPQIKHPFLTRDTSLPSVRSEAGCE